ncbi:hypothetical protein RUM44_000348 [Polyplax serrata]|uniref:Cytochrome P450 n=1 Tax=Polyplax serrata TaxID=468196 RepID=A0ABR1B5B2_POLSC
MFYKWRYRYWKSQKVRSTNPIFPLGDVSQAAFRKNIGVVLREIYEAFPEERFNGMWFFYRPHLMVRDPDLIKLIFVRDFSYFRDRGVHFNEKTDPISANLFFMGGTKWRNLRAKLSSNFSSGKLKKIFDVMATKSLNLKDVLSVPADEEKIIEPKEYTVRYTHDIAASTLLGIQDDSLTNPKAPLPKLGRKLFEPSWPSIIRNALIFFLPELANFLRVGITPSVISNFFTETITNVMEFEESERGEESTNDFMKLLVKLKNEGFVKDVDVKDINGNVDHKVTGGCTFTSENAVAQAFIFWMGAFESSATTMQFALYEMSRNQTIQDKAREEVKRVFAKFNGKLTYESLSELEYLGRLVDETLRKYPPVPMLTRICMKSYKIPGTDVVIEKGIPIVISISGLHMDPKYYPDPEKFEPDRFTEEEKRKRHRYAYLPFGEGLHQCLGQRYALMQIKIGLANLLANYKFEVSPKTPNKPKFCRKLVLYAVRNGIPLKISKLSGET